MHDGVQELTLQERINIIEQCAGRSFLYDGVLSSDLLQHGYDNNISVGSFIRINMLDAVIFYYSSYGFNSFRVLHKEYEISTCNDIFTTDNSYLITFGVIGVAQWKIFQVIPQHN